MFYVYVLAEESTGKTYIGYSSNLQKRVAQHQAGSGAKYTRTGKWRLAYYEAYASKHDAMTRERKLKHYGQSRTHLFRRIRDSIDWVKISAGEACDSSPGKRRP